MGIYESQNYVLSNTTVTWIWGTLYIPIRQIPERKNGWHLMIQVSWDLKTQKYSTLMQYPAFGASDWSHNITSIFGKPHSKEIAFCGGPYYIMVLGYEGFLSTSPQLLWAEDSQAIETETVTLVFLVLPLRPFSPFLEKLYMFETQMALSSHFHSNSSSW